MAFRVVRQRREARRNAKLDEIFMVKTGGRLKPYDLAFEFP